MAGIKYKALYGANWQPSITLYGEQFTGGSLCVHTCDAINQSDFDKVCKWSCAFCALEIFEPRRLLHIWHDAHDYHQQSYSHYHLIETVTDDGNLFCPNNCIATIFEIEMWFRLKFTLKMGRTNFECLSPYFGKSFFLHWNHCNLCYYVIQSALYNTCYTPHNDN